MSVLVVADIDHHVVDGISLAGLFLGILGSLFFTYDLLGRPGGPLRLFLRVFPPALIGTLIVGAISLAFTNAIEQSNPTPGSDPTLVVLSVTLVMAAFGAILGTYNGLFVDAPDSEKKRRFPYSPRDAGIGFLVFLVILTLALTIYDLLAKVDPTQDVFSPQQFLSTTIACVMGGLLAGIWRFLNRTRPETRPRPHLFSRRGCLIGLATGLLVPTMALVALFWLTTTGDKGTFILGALLFGLFAGVPGGAISGGVSRYMFWWANSLPPRGLEVIGVFLILLGFLAQAVQPIVSLFDVGVIR